VNFLDADLRQRSLSVMRELLERALKLYPELRFLSTSNSSTPWRRSHRILSTRRCGTHRCLVRAFRTLHRFWKLARLSGLALVVIGLERLVSDRG